MTVFEELKRRGLIAQMTDEAEIAELINNGKATFYIGFDPTADSLHVWALHGTVPDEAAANGWKQANYPDWRRYGNDWRPVRQDRYAENDDKGNHSAQC